MAFAVNARVKVTDQSSQWRTRFGTVKSVVAGSPTKYTVRLDGFPKNGDDVLINEGSLSGSTEPQDLDYSA